MFTDKGTELTSEPFHWLLVLNKIKREQSTDYSLHQNGTNERSWWTLFSMARCLLIESKLPKNLWVYALLASAYIRNHCYNKTTRKTQYKSFTGSKPNLNKMHILGMNCFCYIQNKMKLNPCCEKSIFVGYDKQNPAYLIYFLKTMAIKRVRCVKFTNTYDNCSLLKPDNNTENPEYLITYEVELEDNQNPKGEGNNNLLSLLTEKKTQFFCSRKLWTWQCWLLLYIGWKTI